jgi:hypothetical protein
VNGKREEEDDGEDNQRSLMQASTDSLDGKRFFSGLRIHPDPNWIRIPSGQWILIRIRTRIRIPEGKNDPQK